MLLDLQGINLSPSEQTFMGLKLFSGWILFPLIKLFCKQNKMKSLTSISSIENQTQMQDSVSKKKITSKSKKKFVWPLIECTVFIGMGILRIVQITQTKKLRFHTRSNDWCKDIPKSNPSYEDLEHCAIKSDQSQSKQIFYCQIGVYFMVCFFIFVLQIIQQHVKRKIKGIETLTKIIILIFCLNMIILTVYSNKTTVTFGTEQEYENDNEAAADQNDAKQYDIVDTISQRVLAQVDIFVLIVLVITKKIGKMNISVPLLYLIYFVIYLAQKLKKSSNKNPKVELEHDKQYYLVLISYIFLGFLQIQFFINKKSKDNICAQFFKTVCKQDKKAYINEEFSQSMNSEDSSRLALNSSIKIRNSERHSHEKEIKNNLFSQVIEQPETNFFQNQERKVELGQYKMNVEDLRLLLDKHLDGVILFQYEGSDQNIAVEMLYVNEALKLSLGGNVSKSEENFVNVPMFKTCSIEDATQSQGVSSLSFGNEVVLFSLLNVLTSMVNSLNLRRQTMLFSATKSVSQLYQVAISKPQFNNLHYSGVEGNQEVKEMVTFKIECLDIEHRNDKPVYLLKVNFHENIFGSEIDLKNQIRFEETQSITPILRLMIDNLAVSDRAVSLAKNLQKSRGKQNDPIMNLYELIKKANAKDHLSFINLKIVNECKLAKLNGIELNCTGLPQGKYAEQNILKVLDLFNSRIFSTRMNVKIIWSSRFPKDIKTMYLDWTIHRMLLVSVFGGMLSISNHNSDIEIRLSFESKQIPVNQAQDQIYCIGMLKTSVLNRKLVINDECKVTLFNTPSHIGTVELNKCKEICKYVNGNLELQAKPRGGVDVSFTMELFSGSTIELHSEKQEGRSIQVDAIDVDEIDLTSNSGSFLGEQTSNSQSSFRNEDLRKNMMAHARGFQTKLLQPTAKKQGNKRGSSQGQSRQRQIIEPLSSLASSFSQYDRSINGNNSNAFRSQSSNSQISSKTQQVRMENSLEAMAQKQDFEVKTQRSDNLHNFSQVIQIAKKQNPFNQTIPNRQEDEEIKQENPFAQNSDPVSQDPNSQSSFAFGIQNILQFPSDSDQNQIIPIVRDTPSTIILINAQDKYKKSQVKFKFIKQAVKQAYTQCDVIRVGDAFEASAIMAKTNPNDLLMILVNQSIELYQTHELFGLIEESKTLCDFQTLPVLALSTSAQTTTESGRVIHTFEDFQQKERGAFCFMVKLKDGDASENYTIKILQTFV